MKNIHTRKCTAYALAAVLIALGLVFPKPAGAQAYTQTTHYDLPVLSPPLFNPCTGDVVTASSLLRTVEHVTVMSGHFPPQPGDRLSYSAQGTATQVMAQGQPSGIVYRSVNGGTENYHATYIWPGAGQVAFNHVIYVHLVGPRGEQLHWQLQEHVTITPNLDVVVNVLSTNLTCR